MTDVSGIPMSEELVHQALARYPGVPVPVAVARYLLHESTQSSLTPGACYGGLHHADLGQVVRRLAWQLYQQEKVSFTIRVTAEDAPESWDHLSLEVLEVEP